MTEPTEHEQDLVGFAEQAWAALSSGVVCYGVVVDVPAEGLQSHARGLLDLSAGRFAQQVRTLMPRLAPDEDPGAQPPVGTDSAMDVDVAVDDTTPQYFADGVLSMPVTEDGGRRRWVRLQGCTAADAGVVPLLWAGGATHDLDDSPSVSRDQDWLTPSDHDGLGDVVLDRSLVLGSCQHDSALRELVEQSLATLGWSDPACRPSARFERLGQWWWAQMHLPAARGAEQADVVMTVTFTAAEAGTSVPLAPEGSGDVPVITPEVFVRVLAADWPDDLPFWPPGTSPVD